MSSKLGRNDPCHCGSGQKYKKCCLQKTAAFPAIKLRRLQASVMQNHIAPYFEAISNGIAIGPIFDELLPLEISNLEDVKIFFDEFLIPWLWFNYLFEDDPFVEQFNTELTIAENYIQQYQSTLSEHQIRFVKAMLETYHSFYVVLDVVKNASILVRDILLGTEHVVLEQRATHCLKTGDIVFSGILSLDDQSIFVSMAPIIIPSQLNTTLLDFRDWLIEENDDKPLTPSLLKHEFYLDLYDYFIEILRDILNPLPPTLVNTDDELIQLCTTYFNLRCTPETAFGCLTSMLFNRTPESVLSEAKRDKQGQVVEIEFGWLQPGNKKHSSWENTVHGTVRIKPGQLIFEANSSERTERAKALLQSLLGDDLQFKNTVILSPEKMMEALEKKQTRSNIDNRALMQMDPDIAAKMKQMIQAHWDTWFDTPVPILDNKTPRESAQTTKGRERLEALLLHLERDAESLDELMKPDIHFLRKELGMLE